MTPVPPSDLDILETYQGVLGLAWEDSKSSSIDNGNKGEEGATPTRGGSSSRSGLAEFCSNKAHSSSSAAPPLVLADDPLDLSPRFLYDAMHLLARSSEEGFFLGQDWLDAESLPTASSDIGMSVLSFSGARRVQDASRNDDGGSGSSSTSHSCGINETKIEMIYQSIARLRFSEDIISGSSSSRDLAGLAAAPPPSPILEKTSHRPIRWPGDVRTKPIDLVEIGGEEAVLSYETSWQQRMGVGPIVFMVAVVCIALTPLWNWLYKVLRRTQAPPCLEGTCVTLPALGDVGLENKEADAEFISSHMAQLTEKQMELMRSVEVDMQEVETKAGIGQGSFSIVYKVSNKASILFSLPPFLLANASIYLSLSLAFPIVKGYYQNSHVAIKVLRKVDERNFRRFLEEILLHKDLRHPNIVMFRGASWNDGRLLMIIDVSLSSSVYQWRGLE